MHYIPILLKFCEKQTEFKVVFPLKTCPLHLSNVIHSYMPVRTHQYIKLNYCFNLLWGYRKILFHYFLFLFCGVFDKLSVDVCFNCRHKILELHLIFWLIWGLDPFDIAISSDTAFVPMLLFCMSGYRPLTGEKADSGTQKSIIWWPSYSWLVKARPSGDSVNSIFAKQFLPSVRCYVLRSTVSPTYRWHGAYKC